MTLSFAGRQYRASDNQRVTLEFLLPGSPNGISEAFHTADANWREEGRAFLARAQRASNLGATDTGVRSTASGSRNEAAEFELPTTDCARS
jgi:hypothetical protein